MKPELVGMLITKIFKLTGNTTFQAAEVNFPGVPGFVQLLLYIK